MLVFEIPNAIVRFLLRLLLLLRLNKLTGENEEKAALVRDMTGYARVC